MTSPPKASFFSAFTSRRLGAVTLLSLSSGLPLGLVITAVPAWLAMARVDIKTIGLITLVQLPYGFKFVWSPLMDRLRPITCTKKRTRASRRAAPRWPSGLRWSRS